MRGSRKRKLDQSGNWKTLESDDGTVCTNSAERGLPLGWAGESFVCQLPFEVLKNVFTHASDSDGPAVRLVSKKWNETWKEAKPTLPSLDTVLGDWVRSGQWTKMVELNEEWRSAMLTRTAVRVSVTAYDLHALRWQVDSVCSDTNAYWERRVRELFLTPEVFELAASNRKDACLRVVHGLHLQVNAPPAMPLRKGAVPVTKKSAVAWPHKSRTLRAAARAGSIQCLKYAHENGCDFPSFFGRRGVGKAARHLCHYWDSDPRNRPCCVTLVCAVAAGSGNLECLQYLHENGFPWNLDACSSAARNGHLDCLRYVHENGGSWDKNTCCAAAEGSNLHCLRYAHENGCLWDGETCAMAAQAGSLPCLKYAHENNCPWDERTCSGAAEANSAACLQYAHENGCPWNKETCAVAAEVDSLSCLKYAHENNCPWDESTCATAAGANRAACLQYAHENGCPWNELTWAKAVQNNSLECLVYAAEHHCPCDVTTCAEAICVAALKDLQHNAERFVGFREAQKTACTSLF